MNTDPSAGPARRAQCDACLRPQPTCICRWVRPLAPLVEVLILQHPLEVGNAKGSARLLHLSLAGSALLVGETFDEAELGARLAGPRTSWLLYPDTPDIGALGMLAPPPRDPALLERPSGLRLVVLDGTWRKSRKMLYQNRVLQALPRLPLSAMPPSHYRIRKAHAPDQLSTLEAACYALMQLEGEAANYQGLLDAFDGFVGQIEGYRQTGRA
ncbi:MAG: tRNA-uridine aminocarboxypropyltransferase [Pseudomonadota bacterium]